MGSLPLILVPCFHIVCLKSDEKNVEGIVFLEILTLEILQSAPNDPKFNSDSQNKM